MVTLPYFPCLKPRAKFLPDKRPTSLQSEALAFLPRTSTPPPAADPTRTPPSSKQERSDVRGDHSRPAQQPQTRTQPPPERRCEYAAPKIPSKGHDKHHAAGLCWRAQRLRAPVERQHPTPTARTPPSPRSTRLRPPPSASKPLRPPPPPRADATKEFKEKALENRPRPQTTRSLHDPPLKGGRASLPTPTSNAAHNRRSPSDNRRGHRERHAPAPP